MLYETYGGGPSGGYIVDGNTLLTWHQEWHKPKNFKNLVGKMLEFKVEDGIIYCRVVVKKEDDKKDQQVDDKPKPQWEFPEDGLMNLCRTCNMAWMKDDKNPSCKCTPLAPFDFRELCANAEPTVLKQIYTYIYINIVITITIIIAITIAFPLNMA